MLTFERYSERQISGYLVQSQNMCNSQVRTSLKPGTRNSSLVCYVEAASQALELLAAAFLAH